MRPLARQALMIWAVVSVAVAFLPLPTFLEALILVPFLLLGPGIVLAHLVSPEDRRFRWPVAVASGFAVLALVGGALAVTGTFDLVPAVVVMAVLCWGGLMLVGEPLDRVPVLPPRQITHGPRSEPAMRFRVRRSVSVGARGDGGVLLTPDVDVALQAELDARLAREVAELETRPTPAAASVGAPATSPEPLFIPDGWRLAEVNWRLEDLVTSPTLGTVVQRRDADATT